jgi:hypothetical protein
MRTVGEPSDVLCQTMEKAHSPQRAAQPTCPFLFLLH